MNRFNVGDLVRVRSFEHTRPAYQVHENMEPMLGHTYTVTATRRNFVGLEGWSFHPRDLDLVQAGAEVLARVEALAEIDGVMSGEIPRPRGHRLRGGFPPPLQEVDEDEEYSYKAL